MAWLDTRERDRLNRERPFGKKMFLSRQLYFLGVENAKIANTKLSLMHDFEKLNVINFCIKDEKVIYKII